MNSDITILSLCFGNKNSFVIGVLFEMNLCKEPCCSFGTSRYTAYVESFCGEYHSKSSACVSTCVCMRVLVLYCVPCVEITEATSLGLCVVRCGCRVVAHDRDCGGTVNFKPCGTVVMSALNTRP